MNPTQNEELFELKASFPTPLFEQNIVGKGNPALVMKAARETVDLSPAELVFALTRFGYELDESEYLLLEKNPSSLSTDFWLQFCRLLHLPLESYRGYSRWWHLAMIQVCLEYHDCRFPIKDSLIKAVDEYKVARNNHAKQIQLIYDSHFAPVNPGLSVNYQKLGDRDENGSDLSLKET
jgi:hypothetical protein